MNFKNVDSLSSELVIQRDGITVLQPKIFSAGEELLCAVTTRQNSHRTSSYGMNISYRVGDDPIFVRDNRERFFSLLKIREDDLATPSQVHSDRVEVIDHPGRYENCDALITALEGIYLSVAIADCVPVLLYDPGKKVVAAVHSGWRGCRDRILEKTMEKLTTSFDSKASEIQAYIGPSAGSCCYEVGEEVAKDFATRYLDRRSSAQPRLDLRGINSDILLERGVLREHLEISGYCTICHPELFHSYRREKKNSGRMMAVIGCRPKENRSGGM
jgi:YfiH family protein